VEAGVRGIRTVPGKAWFPIVSFYGPPEPLYEKTWTLSEIEERHFHSRSAGASIGTELVN
jgi:hypothetical protein